MKLTQKLAKPGVFVLLLFLISLGLRSINFSQTLTYASDQGEFLIDAAEILHEKPLKLIGIYVSSKKVEDKYFFIGSQFSYFLAFWQFILKHDVAKITYVFAVVNSFAVVFTFLVGRKLYGNFVGVSAALFYATFPFAINYSKMIWNPGLQPLLTIIIIYLLLKLDNKIIWQAAVGGFLLGTELAIEYSSIILLPIILSFIYFQNRTRFKKAWLTALVVFCFALASGISNLILFDLRHDFYNSRLMLKYFLSAQASFQLAPHHILPLLPLIILTAIYVLEKIVVNKKLVLFLLSFIAGINIFIYLSQLNRPSRVFGMPRNWTYSDIIRTSEIIKADQPTNFNITQIIDGDSRSFSMRYVLMYSQNLKDELKSTTEYNSSDWLYVLHYNDQDVIKGGPYELTSFSYHRKIIWSKPINPNVNLSKLRRS